LAAKAFMAGVPLRLATFFS
jgi:CheY-like chemotaxis protein